jgi:LmbE family N-acetylglucosaminyl deacetylase
MISSILDLPHDASPRVLLLGAHCDDIEIGCGGTLQVLAARFPTMQLRWTVLSAQGERAAETKLAAERLLPPSVSVQFDLRTFRESYFPYIGAEIKDAIQSVSGEFKPDLVMTHRASDRHQDHRLVSELTSNAFRDQLILEYEVVKYDGDLTSPNVFVPLDREQSRRKVAALLETFASQRAKYWFTEETFVALMRLRGVECRAPSGYAEAFHCRKLRLLA